MSFSPLVQVFGQGLLIVSLTAFNVRSVSALHYRDAFIGGVAISAVWWVNSRTASKSSVPGARWAYALGAGVGTIVGMWLGR